MAYLQSAASGPVRLLWHESGTGEKRAFVAFGASAAAPDLRFKITGASAIAGRQFQWDYSGSEATVDVDGLPVLVSGGISATLRNLAEVMNSATYAAGIDPTYLPAGIEIQPIGRKKTGPFVGALADIRADLTTHIELRLKTFKGSGGASPATYFDRVATRWLISERRRRFAAKRDPRREECSLDEPVPDRSGAVVTRHELIEEASADPQEVHDLRRDMETLRERLPTDHHRQFLDAKARGGTTNSIAQELGLSRPRVTEIEIEVRVVARISAGTRNGYRRALVAFANWCVRNGRLASSPLAKVATADDRADRRRTRRALTDDELVRLLDAARRRPLAEALTIQKGKRRGQQGAKVSDAVRARLERVGRERALIYKTLVLTGLRKGELASITVSQADLGGPVPYLILHAKDEKARRGAEIPLRKDLAAELRAWLDETLALLQADARERDEQVPARLPPTRKLLTVPKGLIRIFNRDLVFAGIATMEKRGGKEIVSKTDERGRTVDIHALRHTFGTHLCRAGVPLRTAQAAMRHSDPSLTANVYTDPKLLDVAGAVEMLTALGGQRGVATHCRQ